MRKRTTEDVIRQADAVHGGRYGYARFQYQGSHSKAVITCLEHGDFVQQVGNHLAGAGCPQCAGKGADWVQRFRVIHGDRYGYEGVQFVGYKLPVSITCPEHGEFKQTPDNHARGQGCPQCRGARIRASKQMKIGDFIAKATEIHGGKFIYHPDQFSNMLTGVVRITCPKHGDFFQQPVNHLAGKVGCTRCNNTKSSGETQVLQFLSIFAETEARNRTILKPKELDIYLPTHSLAVEYCGMYWHSCKNATEERADKRKHAGKYEACKDQGIRLLTIYESEWLERGPAIRRLLRNAIGKSKGKLMARKCDLRKVSNADARAFYEKYHPQGGAGNGEHYGLYWKDKLVACMRFVHGANDRGAGAKDRTWTLGRYATRVTVAGAASRLFKAFVGEYNPPEVKSFSDNRYFAGGMYEQLGFELEADVPPDYQVWSPKLGLLPKPHYQRRQLPKRLKEHEVIDAFDPKTDPRTEAEMTFLMGCGRIYDCGKKRWVWTNKS